MKESGIKKIFTFIRNYYGWEKCVCGLGRNLQQIFIFISKSSTDKCGGTFYNFIFFILFSCCNDRLTYYKNYNFYLLFFLCTKNCVWSLSKSHRKCAAICNLLLLPCLRFNFFNFQHIFLLFIISLYSSVSPRFFLVFVVLIFMSKICSEKEIQ